MFQLNAILLKLSILLPLLWGCSYPSTGQTLSSLSPSFQYFQQQDIRNLTNSAYSSQSIEPASPQQYSSPMGAMSQDVNAQINGLMQYGYGSDPLQNQRVSQAVIMEQIKNDPNYQNQTNKPFVNKRQRQEVYQLIHEDDAKLSLAYIPKSTPVNNYFPKTIYYRQALDELLSMKNGSKPFSIRRAVFLVENAYKDNTLDYKTFCNQINGKVLLSKKLMKENGIKETDNLGKNYIIQKLFSERIIVYKNDTVVSKVYNPYKYDFNDFWGEKDWSAMFVTKLLATGKGQCHSLPLNYLCIAEGLKTTAYLAYAPEHTYIIFPDNTGRLWNFETTNGNPVSDKWLMESGYINSAAIQNRLYLDTLDQSKLLAHCIADLLAGYTRKFYYDDFVKKGVNAVLSLNQRSLQGLVLKADFALLTCKRIMKEEGIASFDQIKPTNQSYKPYSNWQAQLDEIGDMGYMGMPKDRYKNWLLSLKNEEQREEQRRLKNTLIGHAKGK